jgi:hypothetical protein
MPGTEYPEFPNTALTWACNQALLRFFHDLDEQRYENVVASFSFEGEWHRQGKKHLGPEEIMAMLRGRSGTQVVRHVVSNVYADGASDHKATLRSYVTGYQFDAGRVRPLPVSISGPLRIFQASTEFEQREERLLITRHVMEPVFNFDAARTNA